tara:strand:+ start:678 stop:1334 length:657 start_codon:yes stop_codon:yes gene_type:complete
MLKNKLFYVILFISIAIYAYKFFVFDNYIIKEIMIESQSNRSNMNVIKNELQTNLEKPLHLVNLKDIKDNIESIDWIKRAQVNFDRPKILRIKFIEYDPIYIFNQEYYVDAEGDTFKISGSPLNILSLSSRDTTHSFMYELYQNVKLLVDNSNQDIIAIDKNRDMLKIKLDNMIITVRYSNYEKKLEEFINVYPQLQDIYKDNYMKIDMRYPTGFAVE